MYICLCKAVTDRQIREAVDRGNTRMSALKRELGVCSGCGKCAPQVKEILYESRPQLPAIHNRELRFQKATC